MYYSKDIESFGTGLKRISAACHEAGIKVEFEMLKLGFAVVFYRPDEQLISMGTISDDQINDQINENDQINDQLSKVEKQVLSVIIDNPALTLGGIAERTAKSAKTVQRHLDSLRRKNIVKRVGSRKDGHWEVV
jgi:ATP-dependent DNA helicase RecG